MTPWKDGYRTAFPLAASTGIVGLATWVAALLSVGPPADPILHATTLLWGLLGTGVVGFLLTAYPRQNDAPAPSARLLQLFIGGQALTVGTLLLSWWGGPGGSITTVLGLSVWAGLTIWSARIAVPSLRRKWDDTTAAVPITLAAATVGWGLVRLGSNPRLGLDLGIHAFLLPLALGLLDRLLVFFSSRAVPGYAGRRAGGFGALLAFGVGLRLLTRDDPQLADGVLAVIITRQAWGWRLWTTLRVPMVAILSVGVTWIVAGYLLQAAWPAVAPSIAAHLWLLGGMVTLLVGISMRVTLGHGNQPIRMTPVGWAVWGLATLAVVLRVAGALSGGGTSLYIAAAAALIAGLIAWMVGFSRLALGR